MSPGQVNNIDIVTDAGAIGSIIVIAKNAKVLPEPDDSLSNIGDKVERCPRGQFTNQGRRMRSDWIKVPE